MRDDPFALAFSEARAAAARGEVPVGAVVVRGDAVLAAQVVTQRDAHLLNTREMSAASRGTYPSDKRPLLVVGGPRFDEAMAAELGVDRVFSRGTTPGEVASFLVHRLTDRKAA